MYATVIEGKLIRRGIEITINNRFTTTVKGKKVFNTEEVGSVKLDIDIFDSENLDSIITNLLDLFPDGASVEVLYTVTNTY